jgi:hypothetical protein
MANPSFVDCSPVFRSACWRFPTSPRHRPPATSSFYSQYQSCLSNHGILFALCVAPGFRGRPSGLLPRRVFGIAGAGERLVLHPDRRDFLIPVFRACRAAAGRRQVAAAPVQGMAAGGKNPWNVWANVAVNDTRQSLHNRPQPDQE